MSKATSSWSARFGFGQQTGWLSRQTLVRCLLLAVATTGIASAFPRSADAQYTVYIYNTKRPSNGWFRSGFAHDVYTTYSKCRSSIVSRVNENKRYRTDFEAFAIVRHNSRPPAGALRNYVSATIIYIPGRGYVASATSGAPVDGLCFQHDSGLELTAKFSVGVGRHEPSWHGFLPGAAVPSSPAAAALIRILRQRQEAC
jgi:hypothetical protein